MCPCSWVLSVNFLLYLDITFSRNLIIVFFFSFFISILYRLGDLFPALDVPRKRDFDFEMTVRQSILDLKLQPEDGFILKVRNTKQQMQIY